jgi:hypothetical protein
MPARSGCLSILWKSKLAIDFKRWTHSFELMYRHAIMLYDPPFQNATTWDDGNIGTSHRCNLTKISPTQQTQYVESILKLVLKAAETIAAERQFDSTILNFDNLIIGIINTPDKTLFEINCSQEFSPTVPTGFHAVTGEIKQKKDVVFSGHKNEDIISHIINTFAKFCIGSRFKGELSIQYPDGSEGNFEASMCIKRHVSRHLSSESSKPNPR